MQLQLSKEEQQMFENLSRNHDGFLLKAFIERLIQHIESIRTKTTLSNEARVEAANILETNFIERFKTLGKTYEKPDLSEHQ